MFEQYEKTSLETWIEELYISKGITEPEDLWNIGSIANSFRIHINYLQGAPERAIWDDEAAIIFLKPNQDEESLREKFFHELCHPLRHYGDQTSMKVKTFRELQEIQANQFQLYAATPFYMIRMLEPTLMEHKMITQIRTVFKVSEGLARRRYEQIKRRIYQAKSDAEHRAFMESLYPKAPPFSDETNAVLEKLQIILNKRGVKVNA
jgi:Zn-dependent peptidase ImmA (M78 family)